jgi:orotidine-5'-phosphate decarboxylase
LSELIVALDEPSADAALRIVEQTAEAVHWYKVGYQAYYAYGPRIMAELSRRHKQIFLDLKLHDIPSTVAAAVTALRNTGAAMLTLHAAGGARMLEAAVAARDGATNNGITAAASSSKTIGSTAMRLIAVTVLTSIESDDLVQLGIEVAPRTLALHLANIASACGVDGIVCAVEDAKLIREQKMPLLLVCAGIRAQDSARHDQRRTATAREAAQAGADFIVVGRPITSAPDPAAAARAFIAQCTGAGSA